MIIPLFNFFDLGNYKLHVMLLAISTHAAQWITHEHFLERRSI
jgi:hypothetical protein